MDNLKQSALPKNRIREKETQAERLSKIKLKVNEESRMKAIFNELCALRKYINIF